MIQVKDGQITKTTLPKTGRLKDGRFVSGYDKLPKDILREEGWIEEDELEKGR